MLKHEAEAQRVHKNACNFKPVTRLGRTIGWVFAIPRDTEDKNGSCDYSWVDLIGNVPSDVYDREYKAEQFLKSYRKVKGQVSANALEKRA